MTESHQGSESSAPKQTSEKSSSRRFFLLLTTYGAFLLGMVLAIIPFAKSFAPSRRAVAVGGPIDFDISDVNPGEIRVVKWRGRPVWVVRRNQTMLDTLPLVTDLLADPTSSQSEQPAYAMNESRASDPEWLVVLGVCTHLGCAPLYRPDKGAEGLGEDWQGGFFCPCHGSKFDLSGRVFKSMPAPTNLPVPPYKFVDAKTIRIGEVEEEVA